MHAKGKGRATGKVKSKADMKGDWQELRLAARQGASERNLAGEEPRDCLQKCHNGGERGHKTTQRGEAKGRDHGKKGAYVVGDGTASEAEPQDRGDWELCVVEGVRVGQPSEGLSDELPPGLINSESFGPKHTSLHGSELRTRPVGGTN